MREIKFRAWAYGKYWYLDFVIFPNGKVKFPEGGWDISFDYDNAILEQYTGLHDKNGKEIYEGDIVRAWIDIGPGGEMLGICQVIIENFGNNIQEWTYKEPGFLPEVIGNIHENPELLK